MTRDDPELGPVKLCTHCNEWWPLDDEFWYSTIRRAGAIEVARGRTYVRKTTIRHTYSRCRACWAERGSAQYAARKASA